MSQRRPDRPRCPLPAGRVLAVALGAVIAAGVTGCISSAPPMRAAGPRALVVEGVPAARYGAEECGAGALSAVLAYWGDPVGVEEMDRTLPKAAKGGVLSVDLMLAARSRGMAAELLEGSPALLEDAVRAGEPVILLLRVLNAPRKRADLYHWVVVDGYDPDGPLVRIHFGDGLRRWGELTRLERSWAPTDHLVLRVRPNASPG